MKPPVAPPPVRDPQGARSSPPRDPQGAPSSPVPDPRLGPLERAVLLLLLAAAGIALLVQQGPSALEGWRSRGWPVVQGVVTAKRHYPARKAEGDHVVDVRYAYTVGDTRYEGYRRGFGVDGRTVSAERGDAELSALPSVDQPIAVHYDPKAPERSLLEAGLSFWGGLGTAAGGLLVVASAGWIGFVGRRAKRA